MTRVVALVLDDPTHLALARALSDAVKRAHSDGVAPSEGLLTLATEVTRAWLDRSDDPPTVVDVERPQPPDLLSLRAVAQRLTVSVRTVERLAAKGRLRTVRVEGARRVWVRDLEAYLSGLPDDSQRQEATGGDSASRICAVP